MGTIKFGGKPTMRDKAKVVVDRLGNTTKGTTKKVKPSVKVKPTGGLKKPGVKATWSF